MPGQTRYSLSLSSLFAERDAAHEREREAAEKLKECEQEEDVELRKRLDAFQMTDELREHFITKVKNAFGRGESELMVVSFPSRICSDAGRAIANADVPPLNKPNGKDRASDDPAWLATLPAGAYALYEFWKESLKPGGFHFEARIISYPEGNIGDVGLFFTWPRNALDAVH
ncbi:MAG TPA: hypothetical protein VKI44_25295 [Acetobacteraceae bacterium]|nr:hypothetical protein [Acetobacteraceae bacterium]